MGYDIGNKVYYCCEWLFVTQTMPREENKTGMEYEQHTKSLQNLALGLVNF
jgi:hypothetical protein